MARITKICEFVPGPVMLHDGDGGTFSGKRINFGDKVVKFKCGDIERIVDKSDYAFIEEIGELDITESIMVVSVMGKMIRLYKSEKEYIKENL